MIGIILVGVLCFLFWYTCIKPMSHWTKLGVKQTNPWPLFGDLWVTIFKRMSRVEFIQKVYNLFLNERYVGFYQLTVPTLVLRDPELIKQITVKDFDHFTDHRGFIDPEADPLLGGMLFALKGERWRTMRSTLSGAFTSSKMKNMFHLMEEAAETFVQYFLDKNEDRIEIEMKETYTRLTNDVIATAAFGIKVDSLKEPNNEFYQMGRQTISFSGIMSTIKFFGYLVMPKFLKLLKVQILNKKVGTFFRNIINETIKIREEKGIVRPDMINLLLEARKGIKNEHKSEVIDTGFATVQESEHVHVKKIENLTNEVITAQALIFFLAGFDTVSTAMSFGSYELAINKDIQDRLREEIKEVLKKNNGKVTYDVLLKMKYLDMVVSEILRIWPPASAIDRVCTKPYTIEPVKPDEKPLRLEKGALLLLPIHAIHRDPAFYPNPDKFDPERFSDENKNKIKPYTYIPFGSGPRNCIGSRFALLEIKTLLFNLLLHFEILPSKKSQIPVILRKRTQLMSAEGGFWFELKRIKN